MEAFMGILSDKLGTFFDLTFHHLCPSKRPPIFGEPGTGMPLGLRRLGLEGQGMANGPLGPLGRTRHWGC